MSEVGIRAIDDYTLRVELVAAVPYFLDLTSFITFKPVHRPTIEKFTIRDADGRIVDFDTDWYLQPGNLVCNGPYVLEALGAAAVHAVPASGRTTTMPPPCPAS